jgi:hypothetical protein
MWNNKLHSLRSHLSGWARHVTGILTKEKLRLSLIIDDLEALAEVRPLSTQEIELKSQSNVAIASLLHEEELKWYQRSKSKFILEGDSNTNTSIVSPMSSIGRTVFVLYSRMKVQLRGTTTSRLILLIYYKNLFRAPQDENFFMDETRIDDIPQVSIEENDLLTTVYSKEEVRKAIFQMEQNKAQGSDGFPAEFYQTFWETMKSDLLDLFSCLHARQLKLFCLNFREIILLPKVNEAERIQQHRPICLLNVSFKIFMKMATIRLNTVVDHVVRPSQTMFMEGRNIQDGVVALYKTVHKLHSKKLNGVILKLDFEKTYDKVK